jgi:hypothetical protein
MRNFPLLLPVCLSAFSLSVVADQVMKAPHTSAPMEINPSGRPQVRNGANLFLFADYLFWKTSEENLEYCATFNYLPALTPPSDKSVNIVYSPIQDWRSGVRGGVGYNLGHDEWDIRASWLWMPGSGSRHIKKPFRDHLTSSMAVDTFNTLSASAKFSLLLNLVDLNLGREFCVSKWLTLRPFVGARGGWVSQHLDSIFHDNTSVPTVGSTQRYKVSLEQRFWGVGILTGLETEWGLNCGFSIYGDTSFSLLYGQFKNKRCEDLTYAKENTSAFRQNKHINTQQMLFDLQLGLRWDHLIAHGRFHIRLQAGWEQLLFLDHNKFTVAANDHVATKAIGGNLGFEGGVGSVRFDF